MNAMTFLLNNIELAPPISSGSIFMFPILGATSVSEDPLTLDEGLTGGDVEISETSEHGFVPELLIKNGGSRSLFLLDGEQVVGLKQNRTFNLSMLLPAQSATVVPVSCLERGRWSARGGRPMTAEHVHFAKGRACKMRSVGQSLASAGNYRSDQSRVWEDIDEKFVARGSRSSTCAEADYYSERRDEVEQVTAKFEAQPGQMGALYGVGDRIVGLDLFGSAKLYRSLCEKLSRSYLLDALETAAPAAPPQSSSAYETLKSLLTMPASAFASPGLGETLRFETPESAGAALVVEDRCVHVVVLCEA